MTSKKKADKAKVHEAEIVEAADPRLVDEAVKFISERLDRIAGDVLGVGKHLLENFFENDPELVKSQNPRKSASFAALVEKCNTVELAVSKTWLHNAVSLAALHKELPSSSRFKDLPHTHQVALLPLRGDDQHLESLANKAAKEEWSSRQLRGEVVKVRSSAPKKDGPGRPPKPRILKILDGSLKLFSLESGRKSFTNAQVKELDDDQKKAAIRSAEDLIESLRKLAEKLKE